MAFLGLREIGVYCRLPSAKAAPSHSTKNPHGKLRREEVESASALAFERLVTKYLELHPNVAIDVIKAAALEDIDLRWKELQVSALSNVWRNKLARGRIATSASFSLMFAFLTNDNDLTVL